MQQTAIQVPLAHLEEDLDEDPSFRDDMRYLPDNLYMFKRDDLGDSELDKHRTFYITDEKFVEVKRAYLDKDTSLARKLEIAIVDAESGNVDYQLERSLRCTNCCAPFRKATLTIKSINGIDLFALKETTRGRTFEFSAISGQKFILHRSSTSEKVFEIFDGSAARMGTIAKRYTPINRRIRTRDGHYHIKFNENAADLQDEIKYVVVMGTFLLVWPLSFYRIKCTFFNDLIRLQDFLFEVPLRTTSENMMKAKLCCWC